MTTPRYTPEDIEAREELAKKCLTFCAKHKAVLATLLSPSRPEDLAFFAENIELVGKLNDACYIVTLWAIERLAEK